MQAKLASASRSTNFSLTIIVLAQFACTSLWFASNAILPDLQAAYNLPQRTLGDLTSAIQFGFILGTLVFALFTVADRYSPSKVFFTSAILGSLFNLSILWATDSSSLFIVRMVTGFFLAGIYPVGMKIAADYHEKGLGRALGYLVGALVLGTAFPHLIRFFSDTLPWKIVVLSTSGLAMAGGFALVVLVPNGPFRKRSAGFDFKRCLKVFGNKKFRSAAFGYFGHMWELYTFWAFVPVMLTLYNTQSPANALDIRIWSFAIIAVGGISCVIGGLWSERIGSKRVALYALACSGVCCLLSFLSFQLSPILFLVFLFVWGMAVIADSPQFSTLVAQAAPTEYKGTALTIVNSIGFAITIVSLQVMNLFTQHVDGKWIYVILAIGPLFGLIALGRKNTTV